MNAIDVTGPATHLSVGEADNPRTGSRISSITRVVAPTTDAMDSDAFSLSRVSLLSDSCLIGSRYLWSAIFSYALARYSPPATNAYESADVEKSAVEPMALVSEVDMLGRIQHSLSLNTTQLAQVLQVERPSVYAWLKGGPIRSKNRIRLLEVYSVAQSWWNRAHTPIGQYLYLEGANHVTILSLLLAPEIVSDAFEAFFKVAQRRIKEVRDTNPKPFHEVAARLGYRRIPKSARELNLRRLGEAPR